MPKTKLFLSSASQASFTALRSTSFEKLRSLGHDPMMFEQNFGAWHSAEDSIDKCIRLVSECDIFILFVGSRAGSVTPFGRSVTHLEFEQALIEEKPILVFVETEIKTAFLGSLKSLIDEYINTNRANGLNKPAPVEIVNHIFLNKAGMNPDLQHVEDYVWYFLYEIMSEEKIFVQNLIPGVAIDWETVLSDMLRSGVEMLRNKKDIVKQMTQTIELQHYKTFSSKLIPFLKLGIKAELPHVISEIKRSGLGNHVVNNFGYLERKIGVIHPCSAVTIYKQDHTKMVLAHAEGEVTSRDFEMNDDSSYVVLTQKGASNNIFFREDNKMLYVCLKGMGFVLTFHFPCGDEWSLQMYLDYQSKVEDAIMNKNGELFGMAISILEGVI